MYTTPPIRHSQCEKFWDDSENLCVTGAVMKPMIAETGSWLASYSELLWQVINSTKYELCLITDRNIIFHLDETQQAFLIWQVNYLMLFRQTVAVYSKNRVKLIICYVSPNNRLQRPVVPWIWYGILYLSTSSFDWSILFSSLHIIKCTICSGIASVV
jgi:hypothetical protein